MNLKPLSDVQSAIEDGLQPYFTSKNEAYIQLYQRIPFGKYLYAPFELDFESYPYADFCDRNYAIPLSLVTFYVLAIYFGTKYMATRERCDLRYKLAYWNAFLSIFSFMGALRTVPDLLYRLGSEKFVDTITSPSMWGHGATGLWVTLFIFSKIPELIDTYFIVARQRPLIFLHWYHHVTVLLYCWHSFATQAPQALYFVAMNYSVHAVMYGYYCLMALKMKPKWLPPIIITVAQISQMAVGVSIQIAASYQFFTNPNAGMNGWNIFWGGLMYASYFFLFTKFAVERYLFAPKKKAA